MRVRLASLGLTLAAAAAAPLGATLGAQAAPAGAAPATAAPVTAAVPGCTYDTCALRRERVFFSERLLAGRDGRVVGRPQFFGVLPAEELVRAVPVAVPYARTYRREARLGQTLAFVGTVLSVVALVDAARNARGCATTGVVTVCGDDGFENRQWALFAGGVAAGAVGGWRLQISDRALNRAIWYYNRALAR